MNIILQNYKKPKPDISNAIKKTTNEEKNPCIIISYKDKKQFMKNQFANTFSRVNLKKITPWSTSKSLILDKIIPLAFATEHSTKSPLWAVFYALAESH